MELNFVHLQSFLSFDSCSVCLDLLANLRRGPGTPAWFYDRLSCGHPYYKKQSNKLLSFKEWKCLNMLKRRISLPHIEHWATLLFPSSWDSLKAYWLIPSESLENRDLLLVADAE